MFFSRTSGPFSTKLGTKPLHSWIKRIQVCSNEGRRSFPREDDYEIAKILTKFKYNEKFFFSKLGTMHPCVKGTQVFTNSSQKEEL